jgi:hypothetical protein
MSDKPTSTLATSVVTTLVTSFVESYRTAVNGGFALANFCAAALAAKLAPSPGEPDVIAIADGIAAALKWEGTKRERQNKSEARAIIRQHAFLPEGMTAFKTATGACGYHDAVRIARAIKSEGTVTAAVASLTAEVAKKKADHNARFTAAMRTFYKAIVATAPKSDKNKAARASHIAAVETCAAALGYTLKTE